MSDHLELALSGGRVLFSTRRGGVSEGPYESLNLGILTDDDQERVAVNRGRLADSAGLSRDRVAMGWQVHGNGVLDWDAPPVDGGFARPGAELPRVDAHTTSNEGLGLLVLVADCLPVALVSPGRVAMVHCGWRGLASGILARALDHFDDSVSAAVGPGIGRCCYEVGEEVLEQFADLDGVADGRMLDLRAIADRQLRDLGAERVEHVDVCTSCRPDLFFSHRRDNGVTGRQGGLVWRQP
jgi:polyphenol oxidase